MTGEDRAKVPPFCILAKAICLGGKSHGKLPNSILGPKGQGGESHGKLSNSILGPKGQDVLANLP